MYKYATRRSPKPLFSVYISLFSFKDIINTLLDLDT